MSRCFTLFVARCGGYGLDAMEALIPVVMFATFAGFVGLIAWLGVDQARRAHANLARVAQSLGLPMPARPTGFFGRLTVPAVMGLLRGRPVRIFNYTTGSGKSRTTWCAVGVGLSNPGRFTLAISREGVLTRVGRVFGVDDVATGDAAFDEQFYIKSSDPAYVQAALIPEVRAQFTAAWKSRGRLQVEGDEVRYAEPGQFSSDHICRRIPALLELAQSIGDLVEARSQAK